jgi:hypothetical protein
MHVRGWRIVAGAGVAWLVACTGPADGRRVAVDSAAPEPTAAPTVSLEVPVTGDLVDGVLSLRAVVADADDPVTSLAVRVESDLQGALAELVPTADGAVSTELDLVPGVHRLRVSATDPEGLVGAQAVSVRVRDLLAPSTPVIRIVPEAPWTGQGLTAEVRVPPVTSTGAEPVIAWHWSVDGVDARVDGPEVSGFRVHAGQVWRVEATASSDGATSLVASHEVIVANGPPVAASVAVLPSNPRRGDVLTCAHAQPVDPEGDPFTLRIAWQVDGVEVVADSATLDTADVPRGAAVRCVLVADDGVPATQESDPVQLDNGLPSVSAARLRTERGAEAPGRAFVIDAFTCAAEGVADPDGDAVEVTYRWWIDGAYVADGPRLPAGRARRGSVVECEAVPDDGDEEGASGLSAPMEIGNSAPSRLTVQSVFTTVAPGEDAGCRVSVAATDADGDVLSVVWAWSVDGVARPEVGATLGTTGLLAGQSVTCTATTDDGFVRGPSSSATVVLTSYPPDVRPASSASATLVGGTSGGLFGKVVRRLGDVDQDGADELVVSAPNGDGSGAGKLYVFSGARIASGGVIADSEASWSFVGSAAGDSLGGARGLASGGDVDGDGLVDLVAASVLADAGALDAGEVLVVPGGTAWGTDVDVTSVASVRLRGAAGDWLGTRLAVEDVNGDDLADVIASSPYNDLGGNRAGALVVMLGGSPLRTGVRRLSSADAIVTGVTAGEELGWALDVVGDVDGDGYTDLGAGILLADDVATDAGAGVVLSGARLGGVVPWTELAFLTVRGAVAGQQAGAELAGVGDVDGDGHDDIVIGAKLDDTMGADAGAAWLVYGEHGVPRTLDVSQVPTVFRGDAAGALLGTFATALGDLDADGRGDFLIGAPLGGTGAVPQHGVASLCRGGDSESWSTAPYTPSIRFTGGAASDWFGVNGAGGFTVAGGPAVAIAAERADGAEVDAGAVYVFRDF